MKPTAALVALTLFVSLAACAEAQPADSSTGASSASSGGATAPAPAAPKGGGDSSFDPSKPGLQTGCTAAGTCWAVVVDVPWWLR